MRPESADEIMRWNIWMGGIKRKVKGSEGNKARQDD